MKKDKLVPKRRFKEFVNDKAWEHRKLEELAQYRRGSFPQPYGREEWYDGYGAMPFVQVVDVTDQLALAEKTKQKISRLAQPMSIFVPKGSVIVTLQGSIGRVAITQYDCFVDRTLLIFERYNKPINEVFWAYIIQMKFDIEKEKAPGGTIKTITKEALSNFIVSLPSLEEQEKIGNFFKGLDNLITVHQRKLKKLKELKSSYLSEMFPQEGEKYPKRRFDGFTDPWEQRKLSSLCSMHARIGWQNLRTSEFLDSGDYYLITGTDFEDGRINFNTCHYIDKARYDQDRKIQLTDGSILITKDGTLGKVAYIEGLDKPATLNAGVFNVTTSSKEVDEKYLFQYLKAPFLMDYVSSKATGGTIKHLNQNILVDFPVLLPKVEEQRKIGEYFEKLDNLITLHQR
ncbi:MAG: restriction endonuclease subunit S, partial [Senegalia sp. (in: firmicutes)]|uniref:restriction endonuclease subunit S n=1 Tax=Senegalia sp. (in: firmicutes) TaxID=1924098 RepID=UPI003F9CC36C